MAATPNYGGTLPTDGADNAVWGPINNTLHTLWDSAISATVPLTGLTLSAAGATATFGVAAGLCTDATKARRLSLGSAYTKTTSSWALGTAAGSLDTGAIANATWYHVWLILRSDTGVVDVLTSLSASSPTMPANYDYKRRIGSMKTDGSAQWVKFIQVGDRFDWDVPVRDANATAITNTPISVTLSTPLGVKTLAKVTAAIASNYSGTTGYLLLSPLDTTAAAAALGISQVSWIEGGSVGVAGAEVRTSTASQIRASVDNSNATNSLTVYTLGWLDRRGQDD